jgi:hypothetical protein
MTAYCKTLDCSTLPTGMTLSGALAVLHRCGPNGLDSWKSGKRFEHTEALFKKTNELF